MRNKVTLILLLSALVLTNYAQASLSKKTKKVLHITKKTTKATSYFALGTAFALNCAGMVYALFHLIEKKDKFKMKAAQLALKLFTDTPKILCDNLVPASIVALTASALGSFYTSIKMFKNVYTTVKG